jgi:hypothetical protein
LGLSSQYKENNSEVGKWLKRCFGLHFLKPFDVEDSFTEDIMPECPDPRCEKFADYLVENYVTVDSKFPPEKWACESFLSSSTVPILQFVFSLMYCERSRLQLISK